MLALTGAAAFAEGDAATDYAASDIKEVEVERYEQVDKKCKGEVDLEDGDDLVMYVYDIDDEDDELLACVKNFKHFYIFNLLIRWIRWL